MAKKSLIFSVILGLTALFFGVSLASAAADPTLEGLNATAAKVDAFSGSNVTSDLFLQTRIGIIIGTLLSFVGVIFLIIIVYAGIMWMTAQGNDQQVAKAKGMMINSIIGVVIVFAAYTITNFIGDFVANQMLK